MEILLSFTLKNKWAKNFWHWLQKKSPLSDRKRNKGFISSKMIKNFGFCFPFFSSQNRPY